MVKKIKIIFIEDLHGVREFYDWQINQLREIAPQAVCLEMLPAEEKFRKLCEKLSKGDVSPDEFRRETRWEKHWGTFNGYDLLFEYFRGFEVPLYPIDQSLEQRKSLGRREAQIIKNFQAGKDVQRLVNQSRVELFLIRESVFAQNILKLVETKNLKKLAVLVGINHIERLSHFFNFLDEFKGESKKLSEKTRKKMLPLYSRVHLKFAREKNILALKNPPLVPINALRFRKLKEVQTG